MAEAIVIGGSAGVIDVLRILLPGLPPHLNIPVVIVVHLPPDARGILHEVLAECTPLPMKLAEDKETVAPGTLYFAPPAYHLFIEKHRTFALSVDEPVHYSRPSIDVLFDSAVDVYGAGLVGVLLTGASEDGAAGLQRIREAGGTTLVQTPESAIAPFMPLSAIRKRAPTHVLSPEGIRDWFQSLSGAAHAG